jgi:hypothetical protein
MGVYLYKLSRKTTVLNDGRTAGVLVYAFKLHHYNEKVDQYNFRKRVDPTVRAWDGKMTPELVVIGDSKGKPHPDSNVYKWKQGRMLWYDTDSLEVDTVCSQAVALLPATNNL